MLATWLAGYLNAGHKRDACGSVGVKLHLSNPLKHPLQIRKRLSKLVRIKYCNDHKMKLTLIVLLAVLCLNIKAQTVNIKIVKGGFYQTDTLKGQPIPLDDDESHTFKATMVNYFSKYFTAEYRGQTVFINSAMIRLTPTYNAYLRKLQKETEFLGKSPEYIDDVKVYGKYLGSMLYFKQPVLGMSKGMIEKCMGKPDSHSSTESIDYDADLWTYKLSDGNYQYFYFLNGKVNSIEKVSL
jgi:hypothetical protein